MPTIEPIPASDSAAPAAETPALPASAEDRMWGGACHLAGLLALWMPVPGAGIAGPLALWLALRDRNRFLEEQGRAALNFQITMALLALATLPLVLLWVGIPLLWAITFINAVLVLMAVVKVGLGEAWRYPFTMSLVRRRRAPEGRGAGPA